MEQLMFPEVLGDTSTSKPAVESRDAPRCVKEKRRCTCTCHTAETPGHHCYSCYTRHSTCAICTQEDPEIPYEPESLTRHHLIPKSVQDEDDSNRSVHLCRRCHDLVHTHWTNRELKNRYNTLRKILHCDTFKAMLRNHGVNWQQL